jgi:hypothetical protein
MLQEKPPGCSAEDCKTDDAKEDLDQNLPDSHGDEQGDHSSQNGGHLQGWREFARGYLGENVWFHGSPFQCAAMNRVTAAQRHRQA